MAISNYSIAIDKRERDILTIFEKCTNSKDFTDAYSRQIKWSAQHLTTGDYIIFCGDKAVMVIERKTWVDLAASFRDGRKENINKLLRYRELTGAKIAYLIEGPAFPIKSTKFARIPYGNLRAHLDHLLFRDSIIELHTPHHIGTVDRLFQLVRNISSIRVPVPVAADAADVADAADADATDNSTTGGKTDLELAQISQQLTDIQIGEKIWKCVPFVNDGNVKIFRDYRIADLLLGKISQEQITCMTYQNGTKLGTKRAKNIYIITKLTLKSNTTHYIRILSTVPGISKNTAKKILDKYSIAQLLINWLAIKTDLEQLSRGKSKLGKKAVENIEKYLIGTTLV